MIGISNNNVMKKISKESTEIDLFVNPRPLTIVEKTMISEFIKLDKQKRNIVPNYKRHRVSI